MTRAAMSRRRFLGGAGTLLALPLLEGLLPRTGRAAPVAPRRLLFFYVPCGIHMPAWTPDKTAKLRPLLHASDS